MKSNKWLLLFTLVGSVGLASCDRSPSTSVTSVPPSQAISEEVPNSSSIGNSSEPVDTKARLEKALEKDYSNMTLEIVSVYNSGDNEESYYEFYYEDYTIVYTPSVAENGYDPYTYFHDYKGLNYQYFDADRPNDPTSKAAWMNKGYQDSINYALKYIYFDMNVLLDNLDSDTAIYQAGMYIISDESVVSTLNRTAFATFFENDIEFVALMVGEDGYLSQVIGLQEINNDNDFVQIKFSNFGTTVAPTELPEAPNDDNVMEYWEYKGWDGPYVETYVDSITLTPKKELEDDKLVMDIEDVVQATYVFTPQNANQAKDWKLHSTNESVAKINFDFDDKDGNKCVKITAVGAGDAEVYIKARGASGIDTGVESNRISVHVNALKDQNLEGIKYDLSFTGIDAEENLGVANAEENNLPVSAKVSNANINAGNSSLFGDEMTLIINPGTSGTCDSSVTFDFDDQQVSSISLYYGLYWPADKSNKDWIQTITLDTSNDGVNWESLDIKEEVLNNISGTNLKLLEKEFAPASKVRIYIKSGFVGKLFSFAFSKVAFMADSNCHDHVDFVEVPVESVTISSTAETIKCGKSLTIGYVINPSDATNKTLQWYSTNEEVATFNQNILTASATNTGTTEIYAVAANGIESNKITINVESIPPVDTRILGSWLGDDMLLRAKFTFKENDVTVSVKNSSVDETYVLDYQDKDGNQYLFKDESNNIVRASYQSTTEIYIVAELGSVSINKYTANYSVKRYIPATALTLLCSKQTLNIGESTTISVSFSPNNATGIGVNDEINWVADKAGIVEFNSTTTGNSNLFVRAVGAGEVTITASNGDGITNSIVLVVNEPVKVAEIILSSKTGSNEVEANETLQINAVVVGENGETPANSALTWTSSNSSIASVSATGLVTGKTASDELVTITATAQDDSGVSATITIKVIAGSSAVPSDLVGTWVGIDSMQGMEITVTISADGNAEMDIGGEDTIAFTFDYVGGSTYTFTDGGDNVLDVIFDARWPNEAQLSLNNGEMSTNFYIAISSFDDPFQKI